CCFFFQAEDGIRDFHVTGVQTCALPILAMRYGSMTIKKGLQELVDKGVDEVLLFPLYPQFAMATTETITVLAEKLRKEHFPNIRSEQRRVGKEGRTRSRAYQ